MSVWESTSTWTSTAAWFTLTTVTSTGRFAKLITKMEKTAPYSYWEPGLWEPGLMNEFSPMRKILEKTEK